MKIEIDVQTENGKFILISILTLTLECKLKLLRITFC